jgi:antitoxin YefM
MYNISGQDKTNPMAIQTTYSKARQNLAKLLDEVTKNQETVVIKRRRGESVVMISEKDANSLFETAHLLRSPRNAARLLAALERALDMEGGVLITPSDIAKLRDEVAGGRKAARHLF